MFLFLKKIIYAWVLVGFCLLCFPLVGYAAHSSWHLESRADYLHEKIVIKQANFGQDLPLELSEWEISYQEQITVLERKSSNWSEYLRQKEHFPLLIDVKNYYLWQKIKLQFAPSVTSGDLLVSLFEQGEVSFILTLPMEKDSTQVSINEKNKWEFTSLQEIDKQVGQEIYSYNKLDGLRLAVSIFILAFVIILFYYIKKVKGVYKIIEEEYALVDPELEQEEKEED